MKTMNQFSRIKIALTTPTTIIKGWSLGALWSKPRIQILCGLCLLMPVMQTYAQVTIGNPAVCNGVWGADNTDSLAAGYSVAWISGEIRNQNSYAVSVSYTFKIDGTTVASGTQTCNGGTLNTVYKQVSPARVLTAGAHTISILSGGVGPTRNFTVSGSASYVVTFDAQGGSAASPGSKSVTSGSTYGTLATTARTGYTFAGWWTGPGGTGTQVTSGTTVAITAAQTLYANWTVITYTIALSSSPLAGGTTGGGGTKTHGSSVTATAVANSGYVFVKWTENGDTVSSSSSYIFTASGNRTLVANFTLGCPEAQDDESFGVRTNRFGFNINWASGRVVVVEACTNLNTTNWLPIVTNTMGGGPCYFSDPQWTNYVGRYYRIRSP